MLRFAATAAILESNFWIQYNQLGGVQGNEVPGGVEFLCRLPHLKVSTRTSHNTFTTIPMTRSILLS
jgi:hypothetical protein